eukprot:5438722-Pleurochrysis_carterae.AAC.1
MFKVPGPSHAKIGAAESKRSICSLRCVFGSLEHPKLRMKCMALSCRLQNTLPCATQDVRGYCASPEKETDYINRGAILVYNVELTGGGSRLTAVSRMQIMEALHALSEFAFSKLSIAWKESCNAVQGPPQKEVAHALEQALSCFERGFVHVNACRCTFDIERPAVLRTVKTGAPVRR